MLEFVTMLAIMALGLCAATAFVAFIVGGLLRVIRAIRARATQKIS